MAFSICRRPGRSPVSTACRRRSARRRSGSGNRRTRTRSCSGPCARPAAIPPAPRSTAPPGVAFEGDPSGYIEEYNRQWTQAVAGLRRLLARPTHHLGFAAASGSESSSSSSGSDEADAGVADDWDFNTAAQNAWEDGAMDSYDRIIGGEGTDEDKSRYGDY